MKKRILLSVVSFFMMTAMWASLQEAYQLYLSADENGKTGTESTLFLNMKNGDQPVWMWTCTVVLPEGFTYVDGSFAIEEGRYPEDFGATITAVVNEDNSVTFTCQGAVEDEVGKTITGTDGKVASFKVAIASTVEPGDYKPVVKELATMFEADQTTSHQYKKANEYTWTVEEGGLFGDVNHDGFVDGVDLQQILMVMASDGYDADCDLNGDDAVDGVDYQQVLMIMASL